jgi:hypothetical protein
MRRIRREIFYADGTKDTIENGVTTNTAATSFGLQSDGHAYRLWLVPGGTGGVRGARLAASGTNSNGPGGVGGGAVFEGLFYRDDLADYIAALGTDIPVAVGAGGLGGATLGAGTSNANSAIGALGGVTTFGTLGSAYPGGQGQSAALPTSSAAVGAGGGGWFTAGEEVGSGLELGGAPLLVTTAVARDGEHGGGKGDQATGATDGAGCSLWGGGGGGGNLINAGGNGRGGGRSMFGVPGAGAAGGWTSGGVARAGGDAGARGTAAGLGVSPDPIVGGGPAGSAGATGSPAVSADGTDGGDGVLGLYPGETGGSSGAALSSGGGAASVGRGGDGGFPGGSGGSSGLGSSPAGGSSMTINRGGNGADGVAVVDTLG